MMHMNPNIAKDCSGAVSCDWSSTFSTMYMLRIYLARGGTVISTANDSKDSKITV